MVRDVRAWRDCLRRVGGVSGPGGAAREDLPAGEGVHGDCGRWGLRIVGCVVQRDEWDDAGCGCRATQAFGDAYVEREYVDDSGVQRLSEWGKGPGLREDQCGAGSRRNELQG